MKECHTYKAFEKKQAPTKTAPFGYFWDRNTRKHKIDREAEGRVRAIFDAFDESKFSLTQFAKHCNENNLLPASGTPWTKGRMQKFLTNPFYCGWFRYKGGVYEGSHEPYFPRERYDARLDRLKSNRNGSLSGRRTHLLSKYLKCSECGRAYIAEAQTGANDSGNYVYYKHACRGHQNEHRVREEDLLTSLTATIEANRFSPVFGETLKDLFAHVLKKGQRGHQKEIQTLLAQIEQLDRRKSKLYDLLMNRVALGLPCPSRPCDVLSPASKSVALQNETDAGFLKARARTAAGHPCPPQHRDILSPRGWEAAEKQAGAAKKIAGREKRKALDSKNSRRGSRGLSHRVDGRANDSRKRKAGAPCARTLYAFRVLAHGAPAICAQSGSQVELDSSVIEEIIWGFKVWMVTGAAM